MHPIVKWSGVAMGALLVVALLGAGIVYVASEAVIGRTYQPRAVAFQASRGPEAVARGAHLAVVLGCSDCHGARLTGRRFDEVPDAALWSSNLRRLAQTFSDADFERAIRQGLKPDGTSVVLMPSFAYSGMSDRDLGDLVAYLRSLKREGEATPEPSYGLYLRVGVLLKKLKTDRDYAKDDKPSLDLGSRYAAGRYLAAVTCAECHQTDFAPRDDQFVPTPDLGLVAAYERVDFVHFLRTGKAAGGRELPLMSDTARLRFAHFSDEEMGAIYDYLAERGRRLSAIPD